MFLLYDLIFTLICLAYLPFYLFKGKIHRGFLQRLGILPKGLKMQRPIWIHAVSVGEVMATKQLLGELKKIYPDKVFLLSTVTPTGNKVARELAGINDAVIYLPFDFSWITRRVIRRLNPEIFVIIETEIWPNLINTLYKMKIPVALLNGRISDRSFRGYRRISFLLKPVLNKISLFCVQSERDAGRLIRLGVDKEKIRISGNMKFDNLALSSGLNPQKLRTRLFLEPDEKVLLAGSTHPGEEELILSVYKRLLAHWPKLRLLLAPRHPVRSNEVEALVKESALGVFLISHPPHDCPACITKPVFILDTVGELPSYYALAEIVFVGGSMVKKGGHNILEPAGLGKPIIFGPHMFNFRDIAAMFLEGQAAISTHNADELCGAIDKLLEDPEQARQMGALAQDIVRKNTGVSSKNAQMVKGLGRLSDV